MLYELLWTCEDLWRQLCLLPFRSPTRKCSTKVGCGRLLYGVCVSCYWPGSIAIPVLRQSVRSQRRHLLHLPCYASEAEFKAVASQDFQFRWPWSAGIQRKWESWFTLPHCDLNWAHGAWTKLQLGCHESRYVFTTIATFLYVGSSIPREAIVSKERVGGLARLSGSAVEGFVWTQMRHLQPWSLCVFDRTWDKLLFSDSQATMKDFTVMLKGFPCETGNQALRTDRTDYWGFTALQLAFSGGASSLGLRSQDDRVEALKVLLMDTFLNTSQ